MLVTRPNVPDPSLPRPLQITVFLWLTEHFPLHAASTRAHLFEMGSSLRSFGNKLRLRSVTARGGLKEPNGCWETPAETEQPGPHVARVSHRKAAMVDDLIVGQVGIRADHVLFPSSALWDRNCICELQRTRRYCQFIHCATLIILSNRG